MIRGALAGTVAGLVASWAMESFQAAWTPTQVEPSKIPTRDAAERRHGPRRGPSDPALIDLPQHGVVGGEPSKLRVARAVAEPAPHREAEDEKPIADEAVHHAFGGINGAIYGVLADLLPPLRAANGMLFGAGLWLGTDELMLWGLPVSKAPIERPTSTRLYALASYLVYGLALETVRRAIRRLA